MPVPIPILETSRLLLRPLQALFPHFEILQYMSAAIPWPYPDDGAEPRKAWVAHRENFLNRSRSEAD